MTISRFQFVVWVLTHTTLVQVDATYRRPRCRVGLLLRSHASVNFCEPRKTGSIMSIRACMRTCRGSKRTTVLSGSRPPKRTPLRSCARALPFPARYSVPELADSRCLPRTYAIEKPAFWGFRQKKREDRGVMLRRNFCFGPTTIKTFVGGWWFGAIDLSSPCSSSTWSPSSSLRSPGPRRRHPPVVERRDTAERQE